MTAEVRTALGPDLDWLREVLWPNQDTVRVSLGARPPRGFRRVATFGVAPNARRPRLLVPMSSARACRSAFRQFNDSMSQRARLVKALAGTVVGLGPGRAMLRDRLHIDVAADLELADLESILPERYLASALGRPDLIVAITFGSLRPNRKPVLQICEPDGSVVGYAKVAWNELTGRLVRNEADVLRRWAANPPKSFAVPTLLYEGTWAGRGISMVSAFTQRVWRRTRLAAPSPVAVLREIGERGGVSSMALARSPMWTDIRRRTLDSARGSSGERAIELVERFQQRHGEVELPVGMWHGDWAPWNMALAGGQLAVWDWERARSGAPLGLDAAHFEFQLALRRVRWQPAMALQLAAETGGAVLSDLGVDQRLWPEILRFYLFELFLRYEEATSEGVLTANDPIRHGILEALSGAESGRRL